jgi:hypothetical protein
MLIVLNNCACCVLGQLFCCPLPWAARKARVDACHCPWVYKKLLFKRVSLSRIYGPCHMHWPCPRECIVKTATNESCAALWNLNVEAVREISPAQIECRLAPCIRPTGDPLETGEQGLNLHTGAA